VNSTETAHFTPLRAGELALPLDDAACAALVAEHGPMVKAACLRVLGDPGLADDAAQETFVLFVRKVRTLPARTVIGGWLYHTATHVARTHLRTRTRRAAREAQPEALDQLMPTESTTHWRELEPLLDDAMLALPERQRSLVLLCYFQKHTQRDAARAVECSESVASRELSGAIDALRRFFARRGVAVGGPALIALLGANAAHGTVGAAAIGTAMTSSAVALTSATAATFLMQTTTLLKIGAAAAAVVLGGIAVVKINEPPAPTATPFSPTASATTPPSSVPGVPTRTTTEAARKTVTRAERNARFRPLFGLPKADLLRRLAEMGFPLRERTLDLLLKNAKTPEDFDTALTQHLMLFYPDRLLADAIKTGVAPREVAALLGEVNATWRQKKLENWMPSRGLVEMMRSHFDGDDKLLATLNNVRRPYGSAVDVDPLAAGAKLLAIPAAQRRENQVMELALDWPAERAREMAAWGQANLAGKERDDFFARLAYPAYASGNPDLAAQTLEAVTDPALYALAAPMVAATLAQYDRPEEALAILAKLERRAREETAKLIGKHWALRDPDSAVAWANDLPPSEFNAALGGMFEHLPAATMRTALDGFAKQQPDPAADAAVLRGLSRTTSWTDTATAAEVIPGYYAARGFAPLAAPSADMWKGSAAEQSRALQFDVAARTFWSLAQKQDAASALAWADRMHFASPEDKLIAQAYALPETVEIYQKNNVLGPIRGWINQQLADPAKRAVLETRLA
jgi:RNA polymerase sigma factor (sigma-70 family)